jgi:hypothetical protein
VDDQGQALTLDGESDRSSVNNPRHSICPVCDKPMDESLIDSGQGYHDECVPGRRRPLPREQAQARAWAAVSRALRTGRLVRPCCCEDCGRTYASLHAHHLNGYGPGHELDVIWLDPKCHRAAHTHRGHR